MKDTEQTYVEVATLRELLANDRMDWSMFGMVFQGLIQAW